MDILGMKNKTKINQAHHFWNTTAFGFAFAPQKVEDRTTKRQIFNKKIAARHNIKLRRDHMADKQLLVFYNRTSVNGNK